MRNPSVVVALLATLLFAAPSSAQPRSETVEALDGVDPVLLVQGKEVSGKPGLKMVRGSFEYLFSSAESMAAFQKDPARYEIQLNGLCARMGKATGGRPSDYVVHDGRIYIFGSDECHKLFAADPQKYLPPAPIAMPDSGAALKEGTLLVNRLLEAVGGASAVDAIKTYAEASTVLQKRPTGDVPVTVTTTWRFPGDVRVDRLMAMPGGARTSATLMTPAGMWFLGDGRAYPVIEAGRPSMQQDLERQIIPLLHARHDASFKTASLGRGSVDGVTMDRVRIRNAGVDVTLGLDESGKILSASFIDRSATGEYGSFTILYSDYRLVSGLTLPFAEKTLFNGRVDPSQMRTLTAISINTPVESALFQPGIDGAR